MADENCLANFCRASTKVDSVGMHGSRNGSASSGMSFSSEGIQGCDISGSIPTTRSEVHILLLLKRRSKVQTYSTKTVSRARVCGCHAVADRLLCRGFTTIKLDTNTSFYDLFGFKRGPLPPPPCPTRMPYPGYRAEKLSFRAEMALDGQAYNQLGFEWGHERDATDRDAAQEELFGDRLLPTGCTRQRAGLLVGTRC
jgi:hypothetical protein